MAARSTGAPPGTTGRESPTDFAHGVADFANRLRRAWELALFPPRVNVGQTPSDVLYEEERMRVLHYRAPPEWGGRRRPPVLCVYALINKPYIMDLQPGLSVVESLLAGGLDVYLIDWGTPNVLDQDMRIHDYVNDYVDAAVHATQKEAEVERIHLLGYCMGGTFSAMYTALHPENVRSLALMAAGLDFDTQSSFLNIWSHAPGFDPWKIARSYRLIPADFFNAAFSLLDPLRTNYLKFQTLLERIDDPAFVENFLRMEMWTNDGIPMAGPTYAEFLEKGYQRNLLVKGQWTLDGDDRPIDLGRIDMPVVTIVGRNDNLVPPESTERVLSHVGSKDTTRLDLPSGHIGLSTSRRAHSELWPRYAEWVRARDASNAPPPRTRVTRERRSHTKARRGRPRTGGG
ncbi:MAG: alpha/beta fold hydrolase [Thermoplasmata archaeon]